MEIDGGRIKPRLTRTELDCMRLLAEGQSKTSVAAILGVDGDEIAKRFQSAFEKIGTSNPTHAVALALWYGLIEPSGDG